jgi:chemotaxis signal transduction protein
VSDPLCSIEERLARLRLEFDGAFAEPAIRSSDDVETLLTLSVADADYAVRLREIEGLFADRAVATVPSPLPELLGLSSIRGRLVPVYSLGVLLGARSVRAPRWFVVAEGAAAALAFDAMGSYARARPSELLAAETSGGALCPHTLRLDGRTFGVMSIPSVVRRIESRVAAHRPGLGA